MSQQYIAIPRRPQMTRFPPRPAAYPLPENLDFLPTDDRERFVQIYQQQARVFRPYDAVERSYVGYIAMALYRYEQLLATENKLQEFFPQGAAANLANMASEGRELFGFKNDRELQNLWKSLHREQQFHQASCTRWQKILREAQRQNPVVRL